MNSKKKILAATVGFFMGAGGASYSSAEETQSAEGMDWLLEEVVVTATKRSTSLQDTSIAISVLSEDVIEKRGLVDMNDYLATIPGASFIEYGPTDKKIILRGLSTGPRDPQSTASAYLGDMPISSALAAFDVALVDIERIEVLKGPQGTLYGSNSLGGLVRTIPNAPNLNDISGNLKVDFSAQDESDDTNHSVTGVFNIPLIEDQLALRVAAYKFSEAGYVDIVSSPSEDAFAATAGATAIVKDDSNSGTNEGVRASLTWQPIENLKFGLIHGSQKTDVDNTAISITSLPGYQVSYLNTPEAETSEIEYSNLTVEYGLGWASILSSSSLLNNKSDFILSLFTQSPGPVVGPINEVGQQDTKLKTQEIRLVSNLNNEWEYLAGIFYEEAELNGNLLLDWIGDSPVKPFGQQRVFHRLTDINYEQKAVFGELSYQFSEKWLLTLGGRHFEYDRVDTISHLGGDLPFNATDGEEDISASGNTYKVNLAFTPNDNSLIYGQWSEGFRLGRGQALPNEALCDVDNDGKLDFTDGELTARIESDTTSNLELGLKVSLLDNRLLVNTAIFETDWDNIPTSIRKTSDTCLNNEIINNIGAAKSQGIEVDAMYILNEWQFSLSASYMDTKRSNTRLPIEEGEPLIYAPRTNASAGLQYNFSYNGYAGFVRADLAYVGEYASAERFFVVASAGDYLDASLHFGLNINSWNIAFYGTNLTGNDDTRISATGEVGGALATGVRAVPKRLGVKVSYEF